MNLIIGTTVPIFYAESPVSGPSWGRQITKADNYVVDAIAIRYTDD